MAAAFAAAVEYNGAVAVPLPIGVVVEDVAAVEYNGAAADLYR